MKTFKVKKLAMSSTKFKVRSFGKPKNLEAELAAEMDQVAAVVEKTAEQLRMDRETARTQQQFLDEFDTEFWFCVVFQSREQKDAFLKQTGWGEKLDADKYLSGTRLAREMGLQLPPSPKWRPAPAPGPRWKALARPLKP